MCYVYVLYSKKLDRLYKGYCEDAKKRFYQHKNGLVKSTKVTDDWILIYYQVFKNKTDPLREEKFLKSGKGRERLKFLLRNTLGGVA